ncbi:MAG: chorismate synthase [Ruminococcus sp.]|nr:chorismate synthase [Ruminococcus sp.]
MSLIWNNNISVSYFGEAHDPVIGVTIAGLPEGEHIDAEALISFLKRIAPKSCGGTSVPSPRIMSGIRNDRTTGAPLCAILKNCGVEEEVDEPQSPSLRAGNADYTGAVRYKGYCDVKKAAHAPERFVSALCVAGAVCGQILERRGIYTGAHIAAIHNIKDNPFDPVNISRDGILSIRIKDLPVISDRKGWIMLEDISMAAECGESLGGVVECASVNVPCGVGSPVFDGLENNIASLVFGIPGIAGIEFGAGFSSAAMVGSQYSDGSFTDGKGYSVTKTNSHGGIIGGISSGMPITLRAAVKPPKIGGDCVCAVPGAVVCVEAAVNIALLSNMLDYPNFC